MLGFDKFVDWYRKHSEPCKTCLVKPACKSWVDCDHYKKYINRYQALERIDDWLEVGAIIVITICVVLYIISTFLMGMWKQLELIKALFS